MRMRELLRDVVLVAAAAAVGWWCHGAGTLVEAQHASSSARGDDGSLGFQIIGEGSTTSLALYTSSNHTLYVYPRVGVGNSHISCEYIFRINRPGAPIDRENCPVGEYLP